MSGVSVAGLKTNCGEALPIIIDVKKREI